MEIHHVFVLVLAVSSMPGMLLADDVLSMKNLDRKLEFFIKDNGYPGAVLGVMHDGKVSYVKSYGNNAYGEEMSASDLLPVSSLSKTLTAVAIMKLVEEGKLNTTTKVFGSTGALWMLKPMKGVKVDPRLHDITIDHLLRHTAGWNQDIAPLYDPMLNRLYVLRKYHILDLTQEMNVKGNLLPYHMIRYVISKKLDFTPGTEYHYYNLGYSMLGSIIEETTGLSYDEYVRETILIPAGMWQTRMGPHRSPKTKKDGSARIDELSIEQVIHPEVIDSTLGWHSTLPDMLRLMSCLDGSNKMQLLKRETVLEMLSKPSEPFPQHIDKWTAYGFIAKNDGSFWQVADDHFDDFIFHNDGFRRSLSNHVAKDISTVQKKHTLSFAFFLTGSRHKHLKHIVKKIIKEVSVWPKTGDYIDDLMDMKTNAEGIETISKFRLPEPHLSAYSNALKNLEYVPKWVSAHQFQEKTYFSTIFIKGLKENVKQDLKTVEDDDFIILHGLTNRKLRKQIHRNHGYHLSFVQSYNSSSHDETLCNVAVLTKGKRRVRHGIGRSMGRYLDLTKKMHKRKYMPIVQSIETRGGKEVVTYILQKVRRNKFKAIHDLSLDELEANIKSNGLADKNLIYLDTYVVHGKTKFSAIFSNEKNGGWLLLNRHTMEKAMSEKPKLEAIGYTPRIIVGYQEDGELMYSSLWKRH